MRIVILGSNGQVGWELQRALAPLGFVAALDRSIADLSQPESLSEILHRLDFDVLVNAAAYTNVDGAEANTELSDAVNQRSVGIIAEVARQKNALFVHYSTDYVFAGTLERPYQEDDAAGPASVYGRTKLAGEVAVRASGARHLIFRTSWVHAPRGSNFVRTILRLARDREELSVVNDQYGAPTSAELIADITAHAIVHTRAKGDAAASNGIFHLTSSGSTTWCDYARLIVTEAMSMGMILRLSPERIYGISSAQYTTVAQRPTNSRLDNRRLCSTFDLVMPPWEHGVHRTLAELILKEV